MKATGNDIAKLIEDRMESVTVPNIIAEYLGTKAGKMLTVRHEKELKDITGDSELRIRKQYGMTNIVWGGYDRTGGNGGGSLLLAHTETSVIIPTAEVVREKNPAYFSAALARNEKRVKALADRATLDEVATLADTILKAQARLKELFAYGTPLDPDHYGIEELVGLSEKRR
jgi:hypothetical protein